MYNYLYVYAYGYITLLASSVQQDVCNVWLYQIIGKQCVTRYVIICMCMCMVI